MSLQQPRHLTLSEVVATVPALLASGYVGVENGRVRDLPDIRTIRWYQSLGILDRPGEFSGRSALYGRRHILQIAAIKKLQAAGLSLEQIQGGIAGRTEAELARTLEMRLRDVDAVIDATVAARAAAATVGLVTALKPSRRETPFWKTRPAATESVPPLVAPLTAPAAATPQPSVMTAGLQSGSVSDHVVIVWNGRPLTPSEVARLVDLSTPIVAFLSSTAITPAESGAVSRVDRPKKESIP